MVPCDLDKLSSCTKPTVVTSWPWDTGPRRSWGGRPRWPTCTPAASCPPSRLGPLSAQIPRQAVLWKLNTGCRIRPAQSWTCRSSFFLDPPSPSRGCCPGLGPQRGTRTSLSLTLSLILWSCSQVGDDVALEIANKASKKKNFISFNLSNILTVSQVISETDFMSQLAHLALIEICCNIVCNIYRCRSRQRTRGWWRGRDGRWVRQGGRQGTGTIPWTCSQQTGLVTATAHCRRMKASHWSEAGHSGLWLAGGAWGWSQLSLTDLSDCITPGNPPTLTRWRQFWFWQEAKKLPLYGYSSEPNYF